MEIIILKFLCIVLQPTKAESDWIASHNGHIRELLSLTATTHFAVAAGSQSGSLSHSLPFFKTLYYTVFFTVFLSNCVYVGGKKFSLSASGMKIQNSGNYPCSQPSLLLSPSWHCAPFSSFLSCGTLYTGIEDPINKVLHISFWCTVKMTATIP